MEQRKKLVPHVAIAAAIVTIVVACGDDGDPTTEVSSGIALQNVTVATRVTAP